MIDRMYVHSYAVLTLLIDTYSWLEPLVGLMIHNSSVGPTKYEYSEYGVTSDTGLPARW